MGLCLILGHRWRELSNFPEPLAIERVCVRCGAHQIRHPWGVGEWRSGSYG